MKNYKMIAASFALAGALAFLPSAARAQDPVTASAAASAAAAAVAKVASPVITKVYDVVTRQKPTPEGSEWLKAEVIHADAVTLIVRERDNGMAVHTFNFSADLQPKMQAMLDKGGFQYGDRVSILFMPQQTVALRVHGRPSKSL
jgi:hypothetical protein